MSTTHACPGGCGAAVPRHRLACRIDWFRLPYELRLAISAAYRRDPDAHAAALAEALDWYAEHPAVAR